MSGTQVNLNRLTKKASKQYYKGRYTAAHKAATLEVLNMPELLNKGKIGHGIRSIVFCINEEMLSSPSDQQLKLTTRLCTELFNPVSLVCPPRSWGDQMYSPPK